jgi:hypothetical protein
MRYNRGAVHLLQLEASGVGPFDQVSFPFCDEAGDPRLLTVVHGGGGVGKTTLAAAIASTRPGHTIVPQRELTRGVTHDRPARIVCQWRLGIDDPDRPHPLVLATPNVRLLDGDESEALRRREQALFDKMAREGGFVFVAIPATRWFSRQAIAMAAPARTLASYDPRSTVSFDDGTRADLARETKQALAYAAISAALAPPNDPASRRFQRTGEAMREAVNAVLPLAGFSLVGTDPLSLEPQFRSEGGQSLPFDALPTRARHLVAFAALPVRALAAAHPERHPREAEGVVVIDEADMHQDPAVQAVLPAALRRALPGVQWILTTTSPKMAGSCDTREVLALRKIPELGRVELYTGSEARTH